MISLERIQKRKQILSRMRKYQKLQHPVCCMCMQRPIDGRTPGDLHEIVSRGAMASSAKLDLLPVELHAILCRTCHEGGTMLNPSNSQLSGHPDTHEGIKFLLNYNLEMWGFDAMSSAIEKTKTLFNHKIDFEEWGEICQSVNLY